MRITNREKWLLVLLLIAGLSYLSFTYVITPNLAIHESLLLENDQLKAKMLQLENAAKVEADLDSKIQASYAEIGTIANGYFTTTKQEELILLINDLFNVDDLNVEGMSFPTPTPEVINNAEFLITDIDINFSGNYSTLMNVLTSIWAFPKSMHIKQINLSISDTADATSSTQPIITPENVTTDTAPSTVDTTAVDGTVTNATETINPITETSPATQTVSDPLINVTGNITLELTYFTMNSGTVDELYTWYIDDQFQKSGPFTPYQKANATIRYIFTGEGANLFNFDRFKKFDDIQGHWMESEIQAFLEAGYIYTNNYSTFGPDQPISRGEFVVLLDSVYQWTGDDAITVDISKYSDYESFSNIDSAYAKAIQKGIQRGYIQGYENNTIAIASPITYGEVELIIQRISNNPSFTWSEVASDITMKKNITSPRWEDKNATMTKAEAVYLLTYFK